MSRPPKASLERLWKRQGSDWRAPAQIAGQFQDPAQLDARLLDSQTDGPWWDLLNDKSITLFVSREYEHFVLAMSAAAGKPYVTYFSVPHPSGIAIDRRSRRMFIASTRNPNQTYMLRPAMAEVQRDDCAKTSLLSSKPFVPVSTACFPGSLYMHDLALVGGQLYGNAVGHNAVVRLGPENKFERVWWPACVERDGVPDFARNYIQLNSIASGKTIEDSYYSASSCSMGRLRPGHLNYKVDGQGVIISGRSREPVCTGLTRPHSARLHAKRIWVANSGYGELGYVSDGKFQVVTRLEGWTRGLCITADIAFVATSRVIPKYARYAPGLKCENSQCGIYAISLKTGKALASIRWPWGNQVFALDWIDSKSSLGFPFRAKRANSKIETSFFYTFLTESIS